MKRRPLWVNIPPALQYLDLTIDIGEIKHASIRAKMTGKLSRKVKKKWYKRDYANSKHSSCKQTKHKWIPERVMRRNKNKEFWGTSFYWLCTRCHCVTNWVWEHELSPEMLSAYKEHTRLLDAETEAALAAQWEEFQKKLASAKPFSAISND